MVDFPIVKVIVMVISFWFGYWLRKEYVLRRVIKDFIHAFGPTFRDALVAAYPAKCKVCRKNRTIALLRFGGSYRLACSGRDHDGQRTLESFTATDDDGAKDRFLRYINSNR